ncbi:MAG: hypothetical protein SGILL_010153 [Bacillariaceae sp.]
MLTNSNNHQRQDSPSSLPSVDADKGKSIPDQTDTEAMTARNDSFTSLYSSNSSYNSYNSSPGSTVTSPNAAGKNNKKSKTRRASSSVSCNAQNNGSQIPPEEVAPHDVLSGRDKAVFNHIGNRRFRVSLALWIPRYEEAQTKSQKAAVIAALCNMLQNEAGVRFLKRHEEGQGNQKIVYYMELTASQTKKKVGHAIRDMSVARKEVTQRRESLKKARRDSKRRVGSDSDGDNDDNASSTSHAAAEENLSQSLTAMLPFVSNDPDDSGETSLEPLPMIETLDRTVEDDAASSARSRKQQQETELPIAQTVGSMSMTMPLAAAATAHPPAYQPSMLSARPPMMHHPISLPPPPLFYAQHYHYHYHNGEQMVEQQIMRQHAVAAQRMSFTHGSGQFYNNEQAPREDQKMRRASK